MLNRLHNAVSISPPHAVYTAVNFAQHKLNRKGGWKIGLMYVAQLALIDSFGFVDKFKFMRQLLSILI